MHGLLAGLLFIGVMVFISNTARRTKTVVKTTSEKSEEYERIC